MKKLLILTTLGLMLSGTAGCRFMECLWRGGPPAQPTCQSAPAVVCPSPCQPTTPCDPCGGAPAMTPSPTYVPGQR
jgi:hypothetical protein